MKIREKVMAILPGLPIEKTKSPQQVPQKKSVKNSPQNGATVSTPKRRKPKDPTGTAVCPLTVNTKEPRRLSWRNPRLHHRSGAGKAMSLASEEFGVRSSRFVAWRHPKKNLGGSLQKTPGSHAKTYEKNKIYIYI